MVLPPLRAQGNARVWCSDSCRVWASHHPGQRRSRTTDALRTEAALTAWAGDQWEASTQPWTWPVGVNTRGQVRAYLVALAASAT